MPIKVRTMRHIMTAGAPACPLGRKGVVVDAIADHGKIRLDMAAQAQIRVAGKQHLVINRTMHLMADRTSFTQTFMLPDKRTALFLVTFKTRLVDVFHTRGPPWPRVNAMKIMTIGTAHFAFQYWMMIRQPEFGLFVHVAGEANLRLIAGVDDVVLAAAVFRVDAPRAMTHLTTLRNALYLFLRRNTGMR